MRNRETGNYSVRLKKSDGYDEKMDIRNSNGKLLAQIWTYPGNDGIPVIAIDQKAARAIIIR